MSRMSEFHVGIIEMVEQGFDYDAIEQMMVAEGYPREACCAQTACKLISSARRRDGRAVEGA